MKKKWILIAMLGLAACSSQKEKNTAANNQDTISFPVEIEDVSISTNTQIDTTMYLFCNIENSEQIDTIATSVYVKTDTVYINYKWVKHNNTMWEESLKFYEFETQQVKYDVEKYIPEIYKYSDYRDSLFDFAVANGIDYLRTKGYAINDETYKQYLLNYGGLLIVWGHPELREGMFIWYEPLKIFVLYYRP